MKIMSQLVTIWKDFFSKTSMHGLRYVVQTQTNAFNRCFWLLCVFGMLSGLVVNLFHVSLKYQQYDFVTKSNLKFISEFEMPAITLCNALSFDKDKMNTSSVIYEYFYHNILSYEDNNFSTIDWNQTYLSPNDIESVVFSPQEFVIYAGHNGKKIDPTTTFRFTYIGDLYPCVTYNAQWFQQTVTPMMSNADGHLILYIDINQDRYAFPSQTAGIRLIVHPADQLVDIKSPAAILSPGNHYEVKLSPKQYTYLPYPYNSFQNKDCVYLSELQHRILKYFPRYTYSGCQRECLIDHVIDKCGCVTEYLVYNSTDYNYCSLSKRDGCVSELMMSYYGYFSNPNTTIIKCDCPHPCSETLYDLDMSSEHFPALSFVDYLKRHNYSNSIDHARNNLMQIGISYKSSMVEEISHEAKLTISDVVSITGGIMGFCLGASILSVLEVVHLILQSILAVVMSVFKTKININEASTKTVKSEAY